MIVHHPQVSSVYLADMGDKEFLFFFHEKREWELPPSILVTRNPN